MNLLRRAIGVSLSVVAGTARSAQPARSRCNHHSAFARPNAPALSKRGPATFFSRTHPEAFDSRTYDENDGLLSRDDMVMCSGAGSGWCASLALARIKSLIFLLFPSQPERTGRCD